MSISLTHTSFAIAGGAGNIGTHVTSALVSQGASVIILSRKDIEAPPGTTARKVDYSNKQSLVEALRGIEVVVSVLSTHGGTDPQVLLADAAKEAGVKLFVPSEFGMRTIDLPEKNPNHAKADLQKHLRSIGLPYVLYYVGLFSDWIFFPLFGFDLTNKHFTVVGPGCTPVSWTTSADIAHFVAYTLTHLTTERLQNAVLGVEGEKLTILEVKKAFEDVHGVPFTITIRDADEVARSMDERGEQGLIDFILLTGHQGYLDVGKNDNALVPGWSPTPLRAAIQTHYSA